MKRLRGLSKPAWLALSAGAGAALAHPPFGFLPGLLGYGLLLALVDRTEGERPVRSAFWRGFLGGSAYFLIGCWWVAEAFFVDAAEQGWMAPFAVVALGCGLGLFWGAAAALYRAVRPTDCLLKVLVFAGALCLLEWLRGHVLTGFPWNLPGETWKAGSAPSQAAALVGAYGLSWLTVAAMAALAAPFAFGRRASTWSLFAGGVGVVAALYAFGAARLAHTLPVRADAPWVRVVQANVRQEAKYDVDKFQSIVDRYLRLTSMAPTRGRAPDIVIWPEGALPAAANDLFRPSAWTSAAIAHALAPGQTLLVGAYRQDEHATRIVYYNSLFALRRDGNELTPLGMYDKYRLVPFGEYLPLEGVLAPLGVKKMVHIGDGFTAGPAPRPMAAPGLPRVQPLICYESLFPGFTREGAKLGNGRADWIVNVSNDAWFGQTSGPWQSLNLSSYRAIEEGLPMVRATPTGVSAVVDGYGRARPGELLPLGAFGVIDAPLPPPLPPTPFARFGETAFWIMLGLSAVALVPALRRRP
ncbi:MAG: acyltransferase [Caulobacteraceae bacterium]|nr:acyltransferase [Caulobacteraceae bacterium]